MANAKKIEDFYIIIAGVQKMKIAKAFNTTGQSVRNALMYLHNSQQAKEIRHMAKQLLLKEAAKIKD